MSLGVLKLRLAEDEMPSERQGVPISEAPSNP